MTAFRHIIGHAGTPVQQSMTENRSDYGNRRMNDCHHGIVLSVYASDDDNNESAIRSEAQHGYLHQCSVLITNDSTGQPMVLEKVLILPEQVTGLNDYYEFLPKGCTQMLSGQPFNNNSLGSDFEDLDGERCLVGFIDGKLDRPFILKWFPHSRNVFDPLTTGQGFANENGVPQALNQSGRKFTRVNGVETTITKDGDVYLDTNFTGGTIAPEMPSIYGRFSRTINEQVGGNIGISVKPSKSITIDFGGYTDGVFAAGFNDSLPQTNPRDFNTGVIPGSGNTSMTLDGGSISANVPVDFTATAGERVIFSSNGSIDCFSAEDSAYRASGNILVSSDKDIKYMSVKSQKTLGLTGVSIVAGFPSNTANPLAPMELTSTGPMTLRSGIIIDPNFPPATPATSGKLNLNSTGDVNINAGNSSDNNLASGNITARANGTIHMTAGGDLNIEVTGSAAGEGINISSSENINADAEEIHFDANHFFTVSAREKLDLACQNPVNISSSVNNPGLTDTINAPLLSGFRTDETFVAEFIKLALLPAASSPVDVAIMTNQINLTLKAMIQALTNTQATMLLVESE